jgi:hypothetical protein
MVLEKTDEPITDRERAAALNCFLCESEVLLGLDVLLDAGLRDRVERLYKAALRQGGKLGSRRYRLLWFLRENLKKQTGVAD